MMEDMEMMDIPMTQAEEQETLLIDEAAILSALLSGETSGGALARIEVALGDVKYSFRVRPLSQEEWTRCRKRNTPRKKNRRYGMEVAGETNIVGYHSHLIYAATIEEDRKKLWDNKAFWDACNVITGPDMVDKLIPLAGKKQQIVARIEDLSGFNDEDEELYEETIKN